MEMRTVREKPAESEKITINLGYVDLGRVDLLVQEGFYSHRSDFIRTAIRNQLSAQSDIVTQSLVRHTLELGLRDFSRETWKQSDGPNTRCTSKWLVSRALQPM